MAEADFVAVDTVATSLLGFNLEDVGYLAYAALDGYGTMDLSWITVVGTLMDEALPGQAAAF